MDITEKIRYFYDHVKIKNAQLKSEKVPVLSVAIPVAAAVSLAVGAAVVIPLLLKNGKKPYKA